MYCSGKREIKNNRVCFFHNTTRMHRWRERARERDSVRVSEEIQRGKKNTALDIRRILTLDYRRHMHIDSSFAFTALQTNGRVSLRCVKDF